METKQAVTKLAELNQKHAGHIWDLYNSGQYRVNTGTAPDEYDERYSEICWGWLISGPQSDHVVATFANGERGNEDFDQDLQGLTIWIQSDHETARNANLERASKALVSKHIGMGEFKRIVRENS